MFFFIGGVQPKTKIIGGDGPPGTCPSCGRPALELRRTDHYLSIFFIPLFPVKKGRPVRSCTSCGTVAGNPDRSAGETEPWHFNNCLACGRHMQRDFEYCPYCGKPLISDTLSRR